MNLILLFPDDFIAPHRVRLGGRRREHISGVHRPRQGDVLSVGMIDGNTGTGTVTAIDRETVELEVQLRTPPPTPLPVTLILALPRPKMLKRIFQTIASMGVKKLILVNSYRVEKSFWQSPVLADDRVREHLILGLEQAKDTRLPEVSLRRRFKPFVEDELPALSRDTRALVAHPYAGAACPREVGEPVTLAVGPEGGFIDYEIDMLQARGFSPVNLGARILKVETAIPALLSKLY